MSQQHNLRVRINNAHFSQTAYYYQMFLSAHLVYRLNSTKLVDL